MLRGDDVETTRTPVTILTCGVCRRSVKVYGKVRRVLCSCGQTLFESVPELAVGQASRPEDARKTPDRSSLRSETRR